MTPEGDAIRKAVADVSTAVDVMEMRLLDLVTANTSAQEMSPLERKIRDRIAELQGYYNDALQDGLKEAAAANLTRMAELKSLLGEFV